MSEEPTAGKLAYPTCPACHHGTVQPSTRRLWSDFLPILIGLKPFRCRRCGSRFFARIKVDKTVETIEQEEQNGTEH